VEIKATPKLGVVGKIKHSFGLTEHQDSSSLLAAGNVQMTEGLPQGSQKPMEYKNYRIWQEPEHDGVHTRIFQKKCGVLDCIK